MEPFELPKNIDTRTGVCPDHGDFESKAYLVPSFTAKPAKQIWTKCPSCSRELEEREAAEKLVEQERIKQRKIEDLVDRAAIPTRFRDRNFDNFIADTAAKKHALMTAREFAENFSGHESRGTTLIFSGNTGTGKNHLSSAILQHIIKQSHSGFFVTAREAILLMRESWSNRDATSEIDILRMLSSVSLLVIDEIGVQLSTDSEKDQLFGIIDGRYRDKKPTLLSFNINAKMLQETVGERSYSRLRECGIWVKFDWEDYRSQRKGAA